MALSRKKVFLIVYAIMLFGLLVDLTTFFPFQEILTKMKFLFMGWCFLDIFLKNDKKIKINKSVLFLSVLLIAYTVIFGLFDRNEITANAVRNNFILMIYYYLLLFLTFVEVKNYNCKNEFILVSYVCITGFLLICLFTHLNELTKNPFFFFKIFLNSMQLNNFFGFIHKNYVGFICFVQFVLSIRVHQSRMLEKYIKKSLYFILFEFVIMILLFLMLISSSSRGAITSIIVYLFLLLITKVIKNSQHRKRTIVMLLIFAILAIVFLASTGLIESLWEGANRIQNITLNKNAFEIYGNKWFGMGFVENGAFQSNVNNNWTSLWGFKTTSSLDIYYVYVYYTTGIVGCIFIGLVLGYMMIKLGIGSFRNMKFDGLILLLTLLFYSVWDVILFAAKLYPAIILLVILFLDIVDFDKRATISNQNYIMNQLNQLSKKCIMELKRC